MFNWQNKCKFNKQTDAFEGRLDALKEKGDKITKKNEILKNQIVNKRETIQKLEQKSTEKGGLIIEAKQEKLDKDLTVISPIQEDPFQLLLAKLSAAKTSQPTKNGKI